MPDRLARGLCLSKGKPSVVALVSTMLILMANAHVLKDVSQAPTVDLTKVH